ncbi:hypothetical protein DFH05DRAFT_1482321 [Lentinula detonsa]|uniref:Uncharacterized protein n=1 Tax=Lentinula detonsa TaxID=2804962 RepID=A0A9W8U0K3_9AGAR|nr:hypothetical protein DFH05DRAFT_1482321 [Lentinula detonsa]
MLSPFSFSYRLFSSVLLVTTLLGATVTAGPLVGATHLLENRGPSKRATYAHSDRAVRLACRYPSREQYESISSSKQCTRSHELRFTLFLGDAGFEPFVIEAREEGKSRIYINQVKAPRIPPKGVAKEEVAKGRPVKERLQTHLFLDLSSTKNDYSLAHFENPANLVKVFQFFSNADTLIAETNKLLKARANTLVEADPEYRLVHDLKDDLDYINTAMIFLTLFQTSPGNPLLTTADLSHWKTRYQEFNRIRGFNTVKGPSV